MPEDSVAGIVVITVDVEDWPQSTWDHNLPITQRSADNALRLLDLLETLQVRSTMFVLGRFAERFPQVVRRIGEAHHEVACHGYGHEEIFRQTPAEFRADVVRAKAELERITGRPVVGYRAPDFSIVPNTIWALEILSEVGFEYDSSIYPVRAGRYGIADWTPQPASVLLSDDHRIVEFPIATCPLLGRTWPVGGGGYHRLLPGWLARRLARRKLKTGPFVFYCHPYEFDPDEFKALSLQIPLKTRLHQGLGRGHFQSRFECFVRRFRDCSRMIDLLRSRTWPVTTWMDEHAQDPGVKHC